MVAEEHLGALVDCGFLKPESPELRLLEEAIRIDRQTGPRKTQQRNYFGPPLLDAFSFPTGQATRTVDACLAAFGWQPDPPPESLIGSDHASGYWKEETFELEIRRRKLQLPVRLLVRIRAKLVDWLIRDQL